MEIIGNSGKENRAPNSRRFSASMALSIFLLSSNLTTAALANEQGGRGAAWDQFKLDNHELQGGELKEAFKDYWQDVRGIGINNPGNDAAAINNAVNNAVPNAAAMIAPRMQMDDFASKAEFKAYKETLKDNALKGLNQSIQHNGGNQFVKASGGFSLDLSSAIDSITLGNNLFKEQASVTISVGGQEKVLGAGAKVTAAEYVAAKQALSGNAQSVMLDAEGRATGGSVDLSSLTQGNASMKLDDLVVPVAVTASGDFSKQGDVRIKGDLVNSGSITAFASDNNDVNAIISARNFTNNEGASINSTVSDLTLSAEKNFANYGEISVTGNLTISGDKSLTNSGTVTAQQNLNIQSPEVFNSGTLASSNANLNLAASASEMNVNNYNGTLSALNGAINVRSADYAETFDTNVVGGDLFSKEVNAYTGQGTTNIYVNDLTGVLNTNGSAAHVSTNTDTLILGNQCLVDDPTYFNTGNIVLAGDIIVGEDLAIIAGGDITTTSSFLTIRAQSEAFGCDIYIVAGANVTGTGSQTPNPLPDQSTVSGNALTASFSGASATGGNIDLTTSVDGGEITTNALGGERAGNITLAAFSAAGAKGQILLDDNSFINAIGNLDGDVNIIAGAVSGTAIDIGRVFNQSGTGGGNLNIINAQPVLSSGTTMSFNQTGTVTTGNSLVPATTLGNGNISIRGINSQGTVSIKTGGNISCAIIDISSGSGIDAGNLYVQANTAILTYVIASTLVGGNAGNVEIITSGPEILRVGTFGGLNRVALIDVSASGGPGDAGSIKLVNKNAGIFFVDEGQAPIISSVVDGDGAHLTIESADFVNMEALGSTIDLNAAGTDHDGGSFRLVYSDILVSSATPLSISALNTGSGAGGSIHIESTSQDNVDASITVGNGSGQIASLLTGATGSLTLDSGYNLTIDNVGTAISAGTITLNFARALTLSKALSATDISITGFSSTLPAPFPTATINANLTATNKLSIDARTVNLNGVALNANSIQISPSGAPLTLNGTAPSVITAPNILVSGTQVALTGTLTYAGRTMVQGQNVTSAGTQSTTDQSYILASTFSGAGSLAGPGSWQIHSQGALVSPFPVPSDITISGTFGFSNIAIISTGNIIFDDASLVTSGGGTITLLAGFDFTIAGPSYFDQINLVLGGPVNNISANATGGSILGGANLITVNGTPGGTGGAVIAVASKGTVELGSITTASSAVPGNGGAVTIIGENGVTVGNITSANASGNAGAVKAFVGTANISPGASFTSGAFSGTVTTGTKTSGNLSVGGVSFGSALGDVQITGALNENDTISITGLGGNHSLTLTTGLGTTNITDSDVNFIQQASSGGGTVNIESGIGMTFQRVLTNWDLNVTALLGNISFVDGTYNSLNATAANGIDFDNSFGVNTLVSGNATVRGNGGPVTGTLDVSAGSSVTITSNQSIGIDAVTRFITNAATISTTSGGSTFLSSTNTGAVTLTGALAGPNYNLIAKGTSVSTSGNAVIKADNVRLVFDAVDGNLGSAANHLKVGKDGDTTQLRVDTNNGSSFIDYVGAETLHLVASEGDDFTLVSTNLANGEMSTEGSSVFTGNVDITTSKIEMIDSLTAGGSINIHNDTGALSVTGFSMTLDAGDGTTLRALNNLNVQGTTSFVGAAFLYGPNQFTLASGAVLNASTNSYITTAAFDNQGGTLNGPWNIVNSGTYSNNPGNITLTGAQDFNNLAIIAQGNIDLTGATFNLNDEQGTGGNLTMIAGYNFTPGTSGQTLDGATVYHTFIPSGSGSIIGGAVINANGTASGGSVLAVATGSINLGAINTSGGTGSGGDVTIIGDGNITLTTINTTGATGDGDVSVQVGSATIPSNFQVQAGSVLPGAGPIAVSHTNHVIAVNSINTDTGNIELKTGEGAGGFIAVTTSLSAHNYDLQAAETNFGFSTLTSNTVSGAAGVVKIRTGDIYGFATPFTVNASGDVGGAGGEIDFIYTSAALLRVGQADLIRFEAGASGGTAGKISLTSLGNVVLADDAVSAIGGTGAGELSVSTMGDLTVETGAFALASSSGSGAKISFTAGSDGTGSLTLNDTSFFTQANATGANSDGGLLSFVGSVINTPITSGVAPLALTATGTGTGDGGTIVFKTNETIATFVGATAKAPKPPVRFLSAIATGGGDAGSITIETGGNLTVNSLALLNASSTGSAGGNLDGASYTLKAGTVTTGALVINGGLDANGFAAGDAGTINLQSRSSTAFLVNPTKAPKNGVLGALSANGNDGEINVTNLAGGITVGVAGSLSAPTMKLVAGLKGALTSVGVLTAANRLELSSGTGAIGGKKPLFVNTANLMAVTNGVVGIDNLLNTGVVTLEDSIGGKGFTLRTATTTVLNDIDVLIGGSILVTTSAGDLSVANGKTLTATNGALTLQNTNVATGHIIIGDDSTVQTLGKGKVVSVVVGALIPKTGTFPYPTNAAPSGVTATNTIKNVIFFDTPGVVESANAGGPAIDNAMVEAKNVNVLFDGTTNGSIVLGKRSFVFADPPSQVQSHNSIAAAITAAAFAPTAAGAIPAAQQFGFVGENATFTSDLSVLSLNASQQTQTTNNAALLTATGTGLTTSANPALSLRIASITQQAYDAQSTSQQRAADDDSYAVSSHHFGGESDGAICSDAIILTEQAGGIKVQNLEHRERVSITNGTVLYVPFKDTTVETPNGVVHIAAKAVALVTSSAAGLAVYDLEDQHKGSVSVESNGHKIVLSPGRHVMLTPHHKAEFAQINSIETISHRNIASEVKNGMRAHTSEFSVISAMDTVKPLKAMTVSKNAQAKHIADRMMKTTAILMHLSGGNAGQYQYFFKPRMTASLK